MAEAAFPLMKRAARPTELEGVQETEDGASDSYAVVSSIVAPNGRVAWTHTATSSNGTTVQQAQLPNALLWEPAVSAALYTVATELRLNDEVIDSLNTTIGIRQLDFDPEKGLLVNGRPVKAKGMCNHQDFAGVPQT